MSKGLVDAFIGIAKSVETKLSSRLEHLSAKVADLEQRKIEAVVGPPGEKGEKGEPGEPGKDAPVPDWDEIAIKAASLIPAPKEGEPGPKGEPGAPGKDAADPDLDLIATKAAALIPVPKDGKDGRDGQDVPEAVVKALVDVSVKAAVEALPKPRDGRDGLPGPIGEKGLDGKDGRDGINGKDGADGLGFEDLDFEYDDAGRLYLCFMRGEVVKKALVPGQVDRGVYKTSESYRRGDGVTWGGSYWIAQKDQPSGKPGEGSSEHSGWRLAVKRGVDGKAGPPGRDAMVPVVKA